MPQKTNNKFVIESCHHRSLSGRVFPIRSLAWVANLCLEDIVLVVRADIDLQANSNRYTLLFYIELPEVIYPNIGQVVLTCDRNEVLVQILISYRSTRSRSFWQRNDNMLQTQLL